MLYHTVVVLSTIILKLFVVGHNVLLILLLYFYYRYYCTVVAGPVWFRAPQSRDCHFGLLVQSAKKQNEKKKAEFLLHHVMGTGPPL